MKVYLKKIDQRPLVLSEDFLKEFTTGLNESDTVYLQNLTDSEQTKKIEMSSFNELFNKYLNNFLQNKDCNILIIYQIKLNYYIVNAIKVQENEYNSLQLDKTWIDTNDNNDAKYFELIKNPEVLKLALKEYFNVVPQLHNITKYYSDRVKVSYPRALEKCDVELSIKIFSSFNKETTQKYIDYLRTLINEGKNEIIKKINFHGTLSAALEVYNNFFNNWLSNGKLLLNNTTSNVTNNNNNDASNKYPLNIILYGAPGTGKTYKTIDYAVAIADDLSLEDVLKEDRQSLMERYHELYNEGRIAFTTFHQSYTYEDFVQGLRPVITLKNSKMQSIDEKDKNQSSQDFNETNDQDDSGSLRFELRDGIFKEIADRASKDPDNNYVIIIDEINRANISRVLGELITLLEKDKRGPLWTVNLPSGDKFYVPSNLYVVGTMNTADKSISNIDVALRRRFQFIEEPVDIEKVQDGTLKSILKKFNNELIDSQTSTDLLIGQAYFMNKTVNDLPNILNQSVIPLLYEYFDDEDKKVKSIIEGLKTINHFNFEIDPNNPYGRIRVITKN